MPYDGYIRLGDRELVNAARTFTYVRDLSAFGLHDCQDCEDLGDALGESYTTPAADPAPWFDPSDPTTGRFFGFYPTAIEGLSTSTRESVNVELVGDGSVQTSSRRAGRDLMVRGYAFAETREALDKGLSWLDNTLNSDACDGERATILSACPELFDFPPGAFELNVPDDHPWTDEEVLWSTTSGTISTTPTELQVVWDGSDAQKVIWRRITGLIPGEQYQVRLEMDGGSRRIQIGNQFVSPDQNRAQNPRWLGSQFDGTIISPAPASNMFDEPDDGPLGLGWRKYVYPSDTAADTITVTDTGSQDRMTKLLEGDEFTVSAYAYAGAEATVELVVRFFDITGGQVGVDTILDTDMSDGSWVQLSGVATGVSGAERMQIEVRYTTSGAIVSGTEFGVWGSMVSPTGGTTYFDGYTDGYVWTGLPDASSTVVDAGIEWTTYFDIFGQTISPPSEMTVLDFIPRSEEVTLYIDTGGGLGNVLELTTLRVWRIPNPGVVAFSTNDFDMVAPSDGWRHDPVTDATITAEIVHVQNTVYSGFLRIQLRAPFGGSATIDADVGPYRQSFGLKPGVKYRLAINYAIQYPGADDAAEPVIEGAISQTTTFSFDADIGDTVQSYRMIEFVPQGSTVTVRMEPTVQVNLGSQEALVWEIEEVMVEEVFEGADTSEPDPLRPVSRTLYGVAAISGPDMTNLRRTGCGWMAEVTFGLRAGNPGVFREPILAGGLPTSVSTTQENIPCINGTLARVNFMYNPSVEAALNPIMGRDDYVQSGGSLSRSNAATPGPVVGEWFVRGAGSDQIVGYYRQFAVSDGLITVEGNTYTHSVFVAADVTGSYDYTLGINYVDFPDVIQDSVNLTANVWTRIENTFTVPLGNPLDLLEFHLEDNGAISGNLYMDGYMLEPGPAAGTVWDDTFENVTWSGTELESALLFAEPEEDITVDPDCPPVPLPPAPPSVDVSCVSEPSEYQRSVITVPENTVPRNLTAFPILTLQAGAQDVRQARIRFWENPDHLTIDALEPCGFTGEVIVSYLPAGATLVIDGVQRVATMTLGGVSQDATHLLYGSDGGPVDWPELTGGVEYLVTLDLDSAGQFADTQMTVELVVKE